MLQRIVTALVLLGAATLVPARVNAEEIDFGQINRFESLAIAVLGFGDFIIGAGEHIANGYRRSSIDST
jgi:hypothetical protein